jgi:hypothetical protein
MTSPLVGKSWGRSSPSDIANNVVSHMAVHHQGHALRCCILVAHFGAATARKTYKSAIFNERPTFVTCNELSSSSSTSPANTSRISRKRHPPPCHHHPFNHHLANALRTAASETLRLVRATTDKRCFYQIISTQLQLCCLICPLRPPSCCYCEAPTVPAMQWRPAALAGVAQEIRGPSK